MKLLCDVCQQNVASVVCCADEAALCPSCDSRVHAANKLASKHQRVPLLCDAMEAAPCDICQERSSFFFCVEDRALLCRECDVSIHSANVLAAKHRRFLLTGIKVGMTPISNGNSQEATSSEPPQPASDPPAMFSNFTPPPTSRPDQKQSYDSFSVFLDGIASVSPPQKPGKSVVPSPPTPTNRPSSYVITKDGTLSTSSSVLNSARSKAAAASGNHGNSTTISIQRLSVGSVPFVAPVLSSFIAAARVQEDCKSNKSHNVKDNDNDNYNDDDDNNNNIDSSNNNNDNNYSNNNSISLSFKNCSSNGNGNYDNSSSNMVPNMDAPSPKASVSDHETADIPGWKMDELLTGMVGVCESGRSRQQPKESSTLSFGHDDHDHLWFAELDFFEEPDQLSSSQEEGVALVPEMPSPPTASGLVTYTRAKPNLPWAFDYLFDGPQLAEPNDDVSVVPDFGGGRYSPTSSASKASKKRKYWMDVEGDE